MNDETNQPAWKPLPRTQRRIVGVLIEKAKTTPDQYPLSLNALVNGCNQKSNRSPQMNLQENQVEDALVELRSLGAAGEVQGASRVAKYRHYMKDWLGVTGAEMAVMAELLLRGDQTIGELRGRANRMTSNEIADVGALRPVLDSLLQKGLIVSLTPPGRGQVVTHALYQPDELAALQQKYGGEQPVAAPAVERVSRPAQEENSGRPGGPPHEGGEDSLRDEVRQLREEMSRLKKEIEDIWSNLR